VTVFGQFRKLLRKTPVASTWVRRWHTRRVLEGDVEHLFTDLVARNYWGGRESVSGTGSDREQARRIVTELPQRFRKWHVETVLDVPCGDFSWMRNVDLSDVDYTGADIVRRLVKRNRRRYAKERVRFVHLNLLLNPLPKVDLILCRDCLVHFSNAQVFLALANICESGSEYLLTTTFPEHLNERDIETGKWRPLNLQASPFHLPAPLCVVAEGCTENRGAHADKSLGLRTTDAIRLHCGFGGADGSAAQHRADSSRVQFPGSRASR